MPDALETEFIVLRKIPYGEHALIVSGISPDYGQLGFIVKGGAGNINRAFPDLDLFKLFQVEFKRGSGELNYLVSVSPLEDFSAVANKYERYEAASWLANFSLLNVMPMLKHPHFFNALEVGLRRLAFGELSTEAILTGVTLAFIFEEGWLAVALQDEGAAAQCRAILEMAAGNPAPNISDECWGQQFEWCRQLLLYNECRLP